MVFFETLGVIAFLVIVVWLLNVFFDEYGRVNSEADEKRRQLEKFVRQEEARKKEYSEWAKNNPEEAARRENEEQERIEKNRIFTEKADDLYDLMQEINYLEHSGRTEHFAYLLSLKDEDPSKYWRNEGVCFPEETGGSNDFSLIDLPWDRSYEAPSKIHMLTTGKISDRYKIPLSEIASLYRFEQSKIEPEKCLGEMKELANWHQFILGQIQNRLIELKGIASRRNTTPIYNRRA